MQSRDRASHDSKTQDLARPKLDQGRTCPRVGQKSPRAFDPRAHCPGGYFVSEILAPLNWLSARMVTLCLLPTVCNEILALKPAALATTWKLPPPPRPSRLPLTLRLLSL